MNKVSFISLSTMRQYSYLVISLLEFYVLATFKVISGWAPTRDSAPAWWLYSAAPLGYHCTNMTWFPTQWPYTDTDLTSHWPILVMPIARLYFGQRITTGQNQGVSAHQKEIMTPSCEWWQGFVAQTVDCGPRLREIWSSQSSQTNDLSNWYLSLPSLALGINRL